MKQRLWQRSHTRRKRHGLLVLTLVLITGLSYTIFLKHFEIETIFKRAFVNWIDPSVIFLEHPRLIKANIILNPGRDTPSFIAKLTNIAHKGIENHQKIVVVTGPYSDIDGKIVGLAAQDGKILVPRTQNWDGIVHIDENARTSINDLIEFNLPKNAYITTLPAELAKGSFFQTHLIVKDSLNQVSPQAPEALAHRRALIINTDGYLGIIDSNKQNLSLFAWSAWLIEHHSARKAVNLDMGTYNICIIENQIWRFDCSNLGQGIHLSNALIFSIR